MEDENSFQNGSELQEIFVIFPGVVETTFIQKVNHTSGWMDMEMHHDMLWIGAAKHPGLATWVCFFNGTLLEAKHLDWGRGGLFDGKVT